MTERRFYLDRTRAKWALVAILAIAGLALLNHLASDEQPTPLWPQKDGAFQ